MPTDTTTRLDASKGRAVAEQAHRRALGAYYTPEAVVNYMVGLAQGLDSPACAVLEPSGGDGAFVRGLVSQGVQGAQIEVWDVNKKLGRGLRKLGVRFSARDSLLNPRGSAAGTFTHVIGNPPYLNKQSSYIKENRKGLRARYASIGVNDTYAMFIALALDMLDTGGQLIFLVSDTFLSLGTHRKLRTRLIQETTIDSITLLQRDTFTDAAVNTAILAVTKRGAPRGHSITINDCRQQPSGSFVGDTRHVTQEQVARHPGQTITWGKDAERLAVLENTATLMSVCDGGLGMHTGDNQRYLGVIEYTQNGKPITYKQAKNQPIVKAETVVASTAWKPYHKTGGVTRWWQPAEHCVRFDSTSRAGYGIPQTALDGLIPQADNTARRGVLISGVATTLCARLSTPGALWDSNKAFVIFPQDPVKHPVEFIIAILNSRWYGELAQALNHTISFQVRDLKRLVLLDFTEHEIARLAELGRQAIDKTAAGRTTCGLGEPAVELSVIDAIVDKAVTRTIKRQGRTGRQHTATI